MFDNIGMKVKSCATIFAGIGIVVSIVAAIVVFFTVPEMALIGIIGMVVGSLFSWLLSFPLYGFGQLIENTDKLVHLQSIRNEENCNKEEKKQSKAALDFSDTKHPVGDVKRTETVRPAGVLGKCELCGKTTIVCNSNYSDKNGEVYNKICYDCMNGLRIQ